MTEANSRQPLAEGVLRHWQAQNTTQSLAVSGNSMWPLLRESDMILVRYGTTSPKVNDIILFHQNRRLFVHRVRAMTPQGHLVARGDNRLGDDPPITQQAIYGIVVGRERFGRFQSLTTPYGKLLSITCHNISQTRIRIISFLRKLGIRRPQFLKK